MALGIFAGLGIWLAGERSHKVPPASADQLVAQMEVAATGNAASTHVFGGKLRVEQVGGQVAVTAEDVPTKACVSAGWELFHKGTVIINGTRPLRISAAKLAELCNGDEPATVTWLPRSAD